MDIKYKLATAGNRKEVNPQKSDKCTNNFLQKHSVVKTGWVNLDKKFDRMEKVIINQENETIWSTWTTKHAISHLNSNISNLAIWKRTYLQLFDLLLETLIWILQLFCFTTQFSYYTNSIIQYSWFVHFRSLPWLQDGTQF